jgi:hypothetical protein
MTKCSRDKMESADGIPVLSRKAALKQDMGFLASQQKEPLNILPHHIKVQSWHSLHIVTYHRPSSV